MAASVVTRSTWTDDSGGGIDGTIIKNSVLQTIFDEIDLLISGTGSYTTLTVGGKLRVEGAGLQLKNASAPAVSAASEVNLYVDSTLKDLLRSRDAGVYERLMPGCGYIATLADVANTVAETTALSFSVGANEMKDGDVIHVWVAFKFKNTSVVSPTITAKWNWGASAQLTFVANSSTTTNASERLWVAEMTMQRVGTDLWFYDTITGTNGGALPAAVLAVNSFDLASNSNVGTISAPTFTSAQTVALKITLSSADVNFYLKPQSCRVWRTPSGA